MLLTLRIRNFAIIDAAELELGPGFTVITGETGAGKSILVNALTLILGGRASAELIRAGADAAEVEALFDISDQPVVRARLADRQLAGDDPDLLVVRRVISTKGRGRISINGGLASVATLAEIVRGLVDISGQHEQQSLLIPDNHLGILDAFAAHDQLLVDYRAAFAAWHAAQGECDRLRHGEEELLRRADYLRFQVDEIERVAPQPGELEALENERRRLAHAERLKRGAQLVEGLLYGEDGSAFDRLSKSAAELEGLARLDQTLGPIAAAVVAAGKEVQEAARELQRYDGRIDADPARLEAVDDRLAELRRLVRKHGGDLEQVLTRFATLKAELAGLEDSDGRLARLEAEVTALARRVADAAAALSRSRAAAAERLGKAVAVELADLDLGGAVLAANLASAAPGDASGWGPDGADRVELVWSANPGEPVRPLVRIASGGELSRLMLAVKRVLSSRDLVSLYVFDEVDTGLGGKTADTIGRKIQAVAAGGHQAIVITHLAPIAAYAAHHWVVRKHVDGGRTTSLIEPVDGSARAEELARMIDGAHITRTTRQAARDMLARNPAA